MAETQDIALQVKGVYKNFKLPHEKNSSIKSGIVNVFKKKDRRIETQHALRNISFEVKKGEFFGILGRNGSGKSTLLKILAEIYQPSKGSVGVHGKLVPFIELGVGFNPELTGRENVYLNGALLGFSKKEIDERYDDIVKFAELEAFMDQKLKNYSSGMQVRLAFSVATRAEADILLVDEVLAVGDADFQRKCYDYFKSLKKSGKTVVFVTHDMNAVKDYCDRAILIEDSKLIYEGSADTAANKYMKQFNASADEQDDEKNKKAETDEEASKRWGNGLAKLQNPKLEKTDEELTFSIDVKTKKEAVNDVVVGIRVIDAEGKLIAGANTLNSVKNARYLSLDENSTTHLTFKIPNLFGNGRFSLGATVRLADKVTICDYWDDIKSFTNTRDEAYYSIVIPADLTIE